MPAKSLLSCSTQSDQMADGTTCIKPHGQPAVLATHVVHARFPCPVPDVVLEDTRPCGQAGSLVSLNIQSKSVVCAAPRPVVCSRHSIMPGISLIWGAWHGIRICQHDAEFSCRIIGQLWILMVMPCQGMTMLTCVHAAIVVCCMITVHLAAVGSSILDNPDHACMSCMCDLVPKALHTHVLHLPA